MILIIPFAKLLLFFVFAKTIVTAHLLYSVYQRVSGSNRDFPVDFRFRRAVTWSIICSIVLFGLVVFALWHSYQHIPEITVFTGMILCGVLLLVMIAVNGNGAPSVPRTYMVERYRYWGMGQPDIYRIYAKACHYRMPGGRMMFWLPMLVLARFSK